MRSSDDQIITNKGSPPIGIREEKMFSLTKIS